MLNLHKHGAEAASAKINAHCHSAGGSAWLMSSCHLCRATRMLLRTHPHLCLHNTLEFAKDVHEQVNFIFSATTRGWKVEHKWWNRIIGR